MESLWELSVAKPIHFLRLLCGKKYTSYLDKSRSENTGV